jgi:hypothetical protein
VRVGYELFDIDVTGPKYNDASKKITKAKEVQQLRAAKSGPLNKYFAKK